jgi:large subunit ribosomal protein L24
MKMKVKTGDNVLVITGKDKGKSGKVLEVLASDNKVVVENINVVTKHQKPRSQQDKGGKIQKTAPIEASNVMVVCPNCNKATRVAHSEVAGKKVRSCKKCGASLDKDFVKASKKEAKKTVKKASELKGATLKQADAPVKEEKTEKKTTAKSTSTKSTTTKKSTTAKKASE